MSSSPHCHSNRNPLSNPTPFAKHAQRQPLLTYVKTIPTLPLALSISLYLEMGHSRTLLISLLSFSHSLSLPFHPSPLPMMPSWPSSLPLSTPPRVASPPAQATTIEKTWIMFPSLSLSLVYIYEQGVNLLHTTCGTPNYVAPEVYSVFKINKHWKVSIMLCHLVGLFTDSF